MLPMHLVNSTFHLHGGVGGSGGGAGSQGTGGNGGIGEGPTVKIDSVETLHMNYQYVGSMPLAFPRARIFLNIGRAPEIDNLLKLPVVRRETLYLAKQLVFRRGYRIHAARLNGRAVAVKVFNGLRAREDRDASASCSTTLWDPNFLQLLGCSSSTSPELFLVYHDDLNRSAEEWVASVLREELLRCVIVGVTMSGLCYLSNKGDLLRDLDPEDFDLLIVTNGEVKISIRTENLPKEDTRMRHVGTNAHLALLDDLCQRAFKEANHLLYRDQVYQTPESVASSIDKAPASSDWARVELEGICGRLDSSQRRELIWKPSKRHANLIQISQEIHSFLLCLRSSSRNYVRHYDDRGAAAYHQCPGYRREEIWLSTTLDRSVILSHSRPRHLEICTVCGHVVDYNAAPQRGSADDQWPPQLKDWVAKCLGQMTDTNRTEAQSELRGMIADAFATHTLWTTDWAGIQLKALLHQRNMANLKRKW
ncbi:hypothetical protein B0H16DRAFT_1449138 [Mycena metata]|uniref:Uncharacterized protein n=1 Tax=Mycena metata TaxID=1033252 RepID=A0AAD7NX46_9AGAR|nr:hypothetical protein B0H16DRAFT_1449138 [Mycena metata]